MKMFPMHEAEKKFDLKLLEMVFRERTKDLDKTVWEQAEVFLLTVGAKTIIKCAMLSMIRVPDEVAEVAFCQGNKAAMNFWIDNLIRIFKQEAEA